jgi:hypothetical protein
VDTTFLSLLAADRGMVVYDTVVSELFVWNGSAWESATQAGSSIWNTSGPDIFYNTGNVGIGINTPQQNLHIDGGAAASSIQLTNNATTSGPNRGLALATNATGIGIILHQENQPLQIGTNNLGSQLYLDPSGAVGLQTNAPNPNADLTLGSTDKGLQLNRVDTATIQPALGAGDEGMIVYDPTLDQLFVWNGNNFEATGSGGGANDTIPANVFSARIDGQAATPDANRILSESYPFIQSVTRTLAGSYTVLFVPGFFTETPSLSANVNDPSLGPLDASIVGASAGGCIVRTGVSGSATGDHNFQLTAQRQGADYQNSLTAPPNVIGQWDINGSDLSYTSGNVGIGTTTPSGRLTIENFAGTELEFTGAGTTNITSAGQMNISAFPDIRMDAGLLARIEAGGQQLNINTDGVGINTATPSANADLTLGSDDRGLQLNRVDTTFLSLLAADRGMVVYDTVVNELFVWNGADWESATEAGGASGGWN